MRNSFIFRLMPGRQRNLYELLPVSSLPELMCKKGNLNVILLTLFYTSIFSFCPIDILLFTLPALAKTSWCLLSTGTEISIVLFWLPLLCDLKWSLNPFVNIYWWDPQALWVIPLLRGVNQRQTGKARKGEPAPGKKWLGNIRKLSSHWQNVKHFKPVIVSLANAMLNRAIITP